jgi:transcriptional regulator with XRE-family HTH domain
MIGLKSTGEMKMNKELNTLLMNVQLLFDTGEITRKLEGIRVEYQRNIETELGIQTGFGHAFSRTSFMRFEQAVKRHTNDQDEDFRQYLNKLMYEKNVTQATLSRRSFIKESTLSRYINGSREIPVYIIFRIALSLKLNLVETETLLSKVGKAFKEAKLDAVVMEAIDQEIYDVIKAEAVLRRFTNGKESLFTEKEQEEFAFSEEDLEIEIV